MKLADFQSAARAVRRDAARSERPTALAEPCTHEGDVVDDLGSESPRLWLRRCARHGLCTREFIHAAHPMRVWLLLALDGKASYSCDRCEDRET